MQLLYLLRWISHKMAKFGPQILVICMMGVTLWSEIERLFTMRCINDVQILRAFFLVEKEMWIVEGSGF